MDQSEEQLDYGEEDHANANANGGFAARFHGGAGAEEEEEIIPDDDDYDDLYQDVNVGFIEPHRLHLQNPQASLPQQALLDPPPQLHISPPLPDVGTSLPCDAQGALPLSSSTPLPHEEESPRFRGLDLGRRVGGESTSGHRGGGAAATGTGSAAGTPTSTPRGDPDYSAVRATESGSGGGSTVFVGELHWWTTDAELEAALSEYGRVKEITFFQERASGKSKGFCQVHFYDSAAARACKEGMNGRVFNGRACVVAFKSPRSLRHMSDANANANAKDNKRISNDGGSARGPPAGGGYDGARNYGRSGRGSHGQGQGRGLGQGRGRSGKGGVNSGGGHYGQGLLGPMGMQAHSQPQPGGLMPPMGNQGFDPSFGRGASGWPSFPGMVAQYPPVGSMGIPLAGVAPHVNPAFFNRGLAGNGMGMMPSASTNSPGMDQTMWPDWAAEGVARRGADSSHGDDAGSAYGYGYGDKIHDRGGGGRSNASRARDSEWIASAPEKRHRSDKDVDWERERYRDKERNLYRDQRNNWDKDDDYERERDRERVAGRPRSKSQALEEDEPHSHPRPLSEYGKRRR